MTLSEPIFKAAVDELFQRIDELVALLQSIHINALENRSWVANAVEILLRHRRELNQSIQKYDAYLLSFAANQFTGLSRYFGDQPSLGAAIDAAVSEKLDRLTSAANRVAFGFNRLDVHAVQQVSGWLASWS